jgi:hypothetical protein
LVLLGSGELACFAHCEAVRLEDVRFLLRVNLDGWEMLAHLILDLMMPGMRLPVARPSRYSPIHDSR